MSPMRPIFLQLCRLEKDDYVEGGGEFIGAILMARTSGRIFDQHVEAREWSADDDSGGFV